MQSVDSAHRVQGHMDEPRHTVAMTKASPLDDAKTLAEGLHRQIVESIDDGIYFADRNRRIRFWAGGAERITGYSADEIVGRHCFANLLDHVDMNGTNTCRSHCPLAATLEDGRRRQEFLYLRHRDGHRVPVRVRTSPVRDDHGTIVGVTEVFTDQTPSLPRGEDVDELRRLAFADVLTGLPNRTHAERVLAGRLASLQRRGWSFGLLLADVDHFKEVNDLHGHPAGDAALRVVARTMAGASRPEDLVARWGGDEFVVVVTAANARDLVTVAERLRGLVARSRPVVDRAAIPVSISVGATVARPDDTTDTLFARADRALYGAKQAGRNDVFVLDADDSSAEPPREGVPARRGAARRRPAAAVRRRSFERGEAGREVA
jgi:diguanylate cyclase (GGDEF)-like protein/PAS domain S-box-containing protein